MLPIGFYRNGLIIQGYKFHEYTSKEAQAMLNDFLEGFFPSEIKGKYPNGTPFKIVDHSEEVYNPKHYGKRDNVQTVEKMYEQFRPYTREEFLNKLPEQVVSRGKVVAVRSEIAKKLGVVAESSQEAEASTEVAAQEGEGKVFAREDLVVVKVRSEKGKNSVLIKVLASDSIEEIYKYAEKYR